MKTKLFIISFLLFLSCRKSELPKDEFSGYDVFLVAGQSNTLNGVGIIPEIDLVDDGILQLGRWDNMNLKIIKAIEPLDHHHKRPGKIGFALSFAKIYLKNLLQANRKVLLIAAGKGSSGFINHSWNKGDPLYEDAVFRVKHVLNTYRGSEFKAILWQQGEADVYNDSFQKSLDHMILSFRQDVRVNVPFILGGMVPYWVNIHTPRQDLQKILQNTEHRVANSAYADPELPFLINKLNPHNDAIHYDAEGQRELGKRYYTAYLRVR